MNRLKGRKWRKLEENIHSVVKSEEYSSFSCLMPCSFVTLKKIQIVGRRILWDLSHREKWNYWVDGEELLSNFPVQRIKIAFYCWEMIFHHSSLLFHFNSQCANKLSFENNRENIYCCFNSCWLGVWSSIANKWIRFWFEFFKFHKTDEFWILEKLLVLNFIKPLKFEFYKTVKF